MALYMSSTRKTRIGFIAYSFAPEFAPDNRVVNGV